MLSSIKLDFQEGEGLDVDTNTTQYGHL